MQEMFVHRSIDSSTVWIRKHIIWNLYEIEYTNGNELWRKAFNAHQT